MERWGWVVVLAAGSVLLPVVLRLPVGPALGLSWVAITATIVVAGLVAVRTVPPAGRAATRLATLAAAFLTLGVALEVPWDGAVLDDTRATVAMAAILVSFVLLTASLLRVSASRTGGRHTDGAIDLTVAVVATATVLFDVVADPAIVDSYAPAAVVALVVQLLVIAAVAAGTTSVLLTGGHRHPAAWFITVAAFASLVGNARYVGTLADPHELSLRPYWWTAYVFFAAGLLHPSWHRLHGAADPGQHRSDVGRLVLCGLALAAVPTVVLRHGPTTGSLVAAIAATGCVALVLWRIVRLLRQGERTTSELRRRAEREAALATVAHAAVTATDREGFVMELANAVGAALHAETAHHPGEAAGPLAVDLGPGVGSVAVVPTRAVPFGDEERRFLRTVSDLATAALRRWDAEDTLRHRSLHDHLTGLPNRAQVRAHLDAVLSRPSAGRRTALLFLDLDGFKVVNDELGHAAGDQLLEHLAARLAGEVRRDDLVGRLAGDEFLVVSETEDLAAVAALADRLVDAAGQPFPLDLGRANVTASVGVVVAEPGDDADRLLHRADQAMYAAKAAGKARVVWGDAGSDAGHEPVTVPSGGLR